MHISEASPSTSTAALGQSDLVTVPQHQAKCSKMSEETGSSSRQPRKRQTTATVSTSTGVNGIDTGDNNCLVVNSASYATHAGQQQQATTTAAAAAAICSSNAHGGRLKFFKDGKFILELERSKEGERISWVSVPRKTFWPPPGTAAPTPTLRQETNTSLSVSDDNSSVQSSPWQRDHSWKQTTPQRNRSKGMLTYFWRSKQDRCRRPGRRTWCCMLARRPYAAIASLPECGSNNSSTNSSSSNSNSTASPTSNHHNDNNGNCGGALRTRHHHSSVVCNSGSTTTVVSNGKEQQPQPQRQLMAIVQKLIEKVTTPKPPPKTSVVVAGQHSIGGGAGDTILSPRKRFLREVDKDGKVRTVDESHQKRSRNRTVHSGNSSGAASSTSSALTTATGDQQSAALSSHHAVAVNGSPTDEVKPANKHHCSSSYSITALLAEERVLKRSPNTSPSHYNAAAAAATTATAGALVKSESPAAWPPTTQYCPPSLDDRWYSESVDRLRSIELSQVDKRRHHPAAYHPHHPMYLPPYMYSPYSLPPYYAAPGIYSRSYMVPPVYHQTATTLHMPLPDVPTCSWTVGLSRDTNNDHKDDDMPLNLSKNATG